MRHIHPKKWPIRILPSLDPPVGSILYTPPRSQTWPPATQALYPKITSHSTYPAWTSPCRGVWSQIRRSTPWPGAAGPQCISLSYPPFDNYNNTHYSLKTASITRSTSSSPLSCLMLLVFVLVSRVFRESTIWIVGCTRIGRPSWKAPELTEETRDWHWNMF